MLNDKQAQAELIARASHYRSTEFSTGIRGTGGLFAPANFNISAASYMNHANSNITVIVQIETETGVENAQEIASVPGIDMLFIGPNDLCCSMGYFAFDHKRIPQVQEAVIRVRDAAKREGKYAGYFCLSAEDAAQRAKMGFEFVNCGADIVAISSWMGSEMAKLKDLLASDQQTNGV